MSISAPSDEHHSLGGGQASNGITVSTPQRFDARREWLDEELTIDARPEATKVLGRGNGVVHAALGALLLGVGWLLGANLYDRHAEVARLQNQVHSLSARVEQAQARANLASPAAAVKSLRVKDTSLRTEVNVLRNKLDVATRQQQARDAQLTSSMARLEKDPRFDQIAGRLDRLERQFSSSLATASIPPSKAAAPAKAEKMAMVPAPKSQAAAAKTEAAKRHPPYVEIQGYILRGIDDGSALVEGGEGVREIAPGDYLPGAGRVERVERRDGEWVVLTSRGYIDGMDD